MLLTQLGPLFKCWIIFACGLRFAEIFACAKKLCSVIDSVSTGPKIHWLKHFCVENQGFENISSLFNFFHILIIFYDTAESQLICIMTPRSQKVELSIWKSPRNRSRVRKYFSMSIRGPDGLVLREKNGVKILLNAKL